MANIELDNKNACNFIFVLLVRDVRESAVRCFAASAQNSVADVMSLMPSARRSDMTWRRYGTEVVHPGCISYLVALCCTYRRTVLREPCQPAVPRVRPACR